MQKMNKIFLKYDVGNLFYLQFKFKAYFYGYRYTVDVFCTYIQVEQMYGNKNMVQAHKRDSTY